MGVPFVEGFDLFGGGKIENNPPPPCPFGLALFFNGSSSSSARDDFGRSTIICFFAGRFVGRVACCGFGAGGGDPIFSSSESLDSESE